MLEIIAILSGMEIVGAPEAKRFKLDAHYLIGLRRVPYSCIRSVLEALPAELRKDCKVDTVEQDLKRLQTTSWTTTFGHASYRHWKTALTIFGP